MTDAPDDDWNDLYDELYDNPLNYQVWLEFQDGGPDLAQKLIAMFQSREPVTREICNLLAHSLKVGLDGDTRLNRTGELQLRVSNDGQRKPGHRKYRMDKLRQSIARAKKMREYRERFGTRSLLSTMGQMTLAGIEVPDGVSQRTLEKDEAIYRKMRKWIDFGGFPLLWKDRDDGFVARWRKSPEAEEDYIRYGAEFEKNKTRNRGKNRSQ